MNDKIADSPSIQAWCVTYVSKILDVPPNRIDPSVEVDRLGLDSSTAVALIMSLEEWLGIELMPELLFEYPTITGLSNHLAARLSGKTA
jgi:acyl carrier protein